MSIERKVISALKWATAAKLVIQIASWAGTLVIIRLLTPEDYDCVAIVTNHSGIDYGDVVRRGHVIVDFRNATKGHEVEGKVWKL